MKVQKYRSCSLPFCRERKRPGRVMFTYLAVLAMVALPYAAMGQGETKPPNILALFGDDIGWFNLSIYHHGMMGYKTPNIDSIGKQGAMFTDAYAEQSCTAGRAAFLTGQHGLRTGMLKVGMPGLPFGLSHQDPTLAQYLKSKDYATGQFGKNHLGDDDHTLPTTHGFDEFFGNLYHLNAEEEPEHPDYPKDPAFSENFGPRGVLHSFAPGQYENLDDVPQYLIDNEGNDLVHYIVGQEGDPNLGDRDPMDDDDKKPGDGQLVIDTGHLTTERMKVIDGAFTREAIRFMGNIIKQDDAPPFFVWYATSRMHTWTHLKKENELPTEIPAFDRLCYTPNSTSGFETYSEPDGSAKKEGDLCNEAFGQKDGAPYYAEGQTGLGTYPDGMVEHDYYIGMLLKFLEDNKIENNTIVIYSSDNGPQFFTWPDGGTTPFRSEKNSNWEGAYRVPLLVRWPGLIEPGYISNDIIALQDWFPTLASAVSEAAGNREDIKELLKAGDHKLDDQNDSNDVANDDDTYRAHLDGYDFYDHWKSCAKAAYFNIEIDKLPEECQTSPRREYIYSNDDGVLVGVRVDEWKIVFHEQRAKGFNVWQDPFVALRTPKFFNLRRDPFERIDEESDNYSQWRFDHLFLLTPGQLSVYKFLTSFKEFPPRQAPPSFTVNVNIEDIIEKCGTAEDSSNNDDCFPPLNPANATSTNGRLMIPGLVR